jgi:hypothetical protein
MTPPKIHRVWQQINLPKSQFIMMLALPAGPSSWLRSLPVWLESEKDKKAFSESKKREIGKYCVPSASAFLLACAASRSARILARRARSDLASFVFPWACSLCRVVKRFRDEKRMTAGYLLSNNVPLRPPSPFVP